MRTRMMPSAAVALLAAALFLAAPVPGAASEVHHVPSEYATIALAFADAAPGDTVRLAPGTYYESGLNLPQGVTLDSANWDPYTTVISGGSTRSTILNCLAVTAATVRAVGFADGSATTGGAVYCDNADVTFDYCVFTGNGAQYGGAIYWTGGTPNVYGCTFDGNAAITSGGGIYLVFTDGAVLGCSFDMNTANNGAGLAAEALTTTTYIEECFFTGNLGSSGGGTFISSQAAPTFITCVFYQNEASVGGGAYLGQKSEASFIACEFTENTVYNDGAGAYCRDEYSLFDGCEFLSNTAMSGGGGGIGAYLSGAEVMGSAFIENSAAYGGGLSIETNSNIYMQSCTIAKNTSDGTESGAGVYVYDGSNADLDETIVAFNISGEAIWVELPSTAEMNCCCFWDNEGGDWVGPIAPQQTQSGNMTLDPYFCGLDYFDVWLCADSPCLADAPENDCGILIGAYDEGCAACGSPVENTTWGAIKSLYR